MLVNVLDAPLQQFVLKNWFFLGSPLLHAQKCATGTRYGKIVKSIWTKSELKSQEIWNQTLSLNQILKNW